MSKRYNSIQKQYNSEAEQANRNAYAGSDYANPNYNRTLQSTYNYEFPTPARLQERMVNRFPEYYMYFEYYTPIDQAYQVSRQTNCMGGAPRLPGLLPCPYGTDAIACASHAA